MCFHWSVFFWHSYFDQKWSDNRGQDTNLLGRDSPGHVYNPKRIRAMPVTSFAGSERPPLGDWQTCICVKSKRDATCKWIFCFFWICKGFVVREKTSLIFLFSRGKAKYPDTSNDLTQAQGLKFVYVRCTKLSKLRLGWEVINLDVYDMSMLLPCKYLPFGQKRPMGHRSHLILSLSNMENLVLPQWVRVHEMCLGRCSRVLQSVLMWSDLWSISTSVSALIFHWEAINLDGTRDIPEGHADREPTDMTGHCSRTEHNRTGQKQARQNAAERNRTGQNATEDSRAKQNTALHNAT